MNSIVLIAGLAIGAVLFAAQGGNGALKTFRAGVQLDSRLDTDGDGVVELHEVTQAVTKAGAGQASPSSLSTLDHDGDGVVEDHELDDHFYNRHRVSLFSSAVVLVTVIVYLVRDGQAEKEARIIAEEKARAAAEAATKAAAEAAVKAAADRWLEKSQWRVNNQAARRELMNELTLRSDPAMAEMGMNQLARTATYSHETNNPIARQQQIDAIHAGIYERKIQWTEDQIVQTADARKVAAETAALQETRLQAAVEEEAMIVMAGGHFTVAQALANMEAAGANPTKQGEFQFACKRKNWPEANALYHAAVDAGN